ncbi:MAG: hypothetical protein HeimAB125_13990 [Candidatus Heimdallarchaeota archaeon AB_125]|nr:MAG: hypothetical protein HeimAB125_13990 [Candidatus Heimdallarchaeota archaeon AB_125]
MTEENKQLKSPAGIKLASLKDLVRLVLSSVGPDRIAGYIGNYAEEDRAIYFVFNTSLGYYELNALPIIVWTDEKEMPTKSFLRYKTAIDETIDFSNDATDPKWLSIPIVKFEIMPEFLKVWKN